MKSFLLLKPYLRENRHLIAVGLASLVAVDFLQLIIPRIIKWTVDDLTMGTIQARGLLVYALSIAAASLFIGMFRYTWRRCILGLSRRVEEGLRNRIFSHIQTLSPSYFARVKAGDIMAHATNDIMNIRMASGMGLVALTDAVVLGGAAIIFMMYINMKLTLLSLVPMPFIALSTRFFSRKMHREYMKVQGAFADMTEMVRERFAGIRIIKAFNMEGAETRKFAEVSSGYVDRNIKLVRITGSLFPLMIFFTNISLVVVLFLGGRLAIQNTITPGDFVAFISYLGLLTWPMMAIGWVTNLIQRGRASLDRINEILTTVSDVTDPVAPLPMPGGSCGITFENLSFTYGSGKEPVLSGIDLAVPPGRVLGIVGPPGSGKTTLLNLIPRFYTPSKGGIRMDKIPIDRLRLHELRSFIAFVPQEPYLFSGTIRENILLGTDDKSDKKLAAAVEKASLTATIASFPNGFDTLVGEKGVILSGGQKQRVALARALVCDAPIMVLDDPISQVDMETGVRIIDTIKALSKGKTVIIVSHRFSALSFADEIAVLDSGRITEQGTHDELMALGGYYSEIFRFQSIEEEIYAL